MTEPRKTPRSDAEEFEVDMQYVAPEKFINPEFARALEIETQELAEALAEYANTDKQLVYHVSGIGTDTPSGRRYATALDLLARHRAKQEAPR